MSARIQRVFLRSKGNWKRNSSDTPQLSVGISCEYFMYDGNGEGTELHLAEQVPRPHPPPLLEPPAPHMQSSAEALTLRPLLSPSAMSPGWGHLSTSPALSFPTCQRETAMALSPRVAVSIK